MNRLPQWLKQDMPDALSECLASSISEFGVNTVCRKALCPNINHCFSRNQATFMILGDSCTRHCRFCNINNIRDGSRLNSHINRTVPNDESQKIVEAVKGLGLEYVVITSVTRDDLGDGGSSEFVKVIELIRALGKDIKTEALIPDFQGDPQSLKKVVDAHPFILAHNLETVRRLYGVIRPQADYDRSLKLLRLAKKFSEGQITKSSLLLGFGESEDEVFVALRDLRENNCDIVTLGQYLRPSSGHFPVKEFITPEQFRKYHDIGMGMGFKRVLSGPKVRSSFMAQELAGDLSYA